MSPEWSVGLKTLRSIGRKKEDTSRPWASMLVEGAKAGGHFGSIRKPVSKHQTRVTDRPKTEFAAKPSGTVGRRGLRTGRP
ncbi:hypothetical protein ACHAQJ_004806 [Trichoderma viride]